MFSQDTYILAVGAAKKYTDSQISSGIFAGYVTNGGSFPTTRLDGSPLQNEDYVRPTNTSTFPFTIDGVTFTNKTSKGYYFNGIWISDPSPVPDTSEVPTKTPSEESISGTALTQAEVNKEFVQKRNFVHEQTVAATVWNITHNMGKYPAVTVIDSAGSVCEGEIAYTDKNNVVLTFSAAFGGKAYLS